MHIKTWFAAAGIAGAFLLNTSGAYAMPALAKAAPEGASIVSKVEMRIQFGGGCAVLWQSTRLQKDGRIGPPGYERWDYAGGFCMPVIF